MTTYTKAHQRYYRKDRKTINARNRARRKLVTQILSLNGISLKGLRV